MGRSTKSKKYLRSAEDGSCPRTLVGHKAPIVDLAVVEKGMNVVGVSK